MKLPRLHLFLLCAALVSTGKICTAETKDDHDRLRLLNSRIQQVAGEVTAASGYARRSAEIDLQVARFFTAYIEWELEHPAVMQRAMGARLRRGALQASAADLEKHYREQIDHELSATMDVLAQASERLARGDSRPAPLRISWEEMTYSNGFFRVQGRPVFPGGFNMLGKSLVDHDAHPEWEEKSRVLTDRFVRDMHALGVGIIGGGVSIPGILKVDGSVNHAAIEALLGRVRQSAKAGVKSDILFNWYGRETLDELWPGMSAYYGNGVALDIDHPGIPDMLARTLSALMPVLAKEPGLLSIDLANEPFFSIEQWSPHSLQDYRAWLQKRHGTLADLNAAWKSEFKSMNEIPLPGREDRGECSSGEWYDRVSFHNIRVARFFTRVRDEIRKYAPQTPVHLKVQDNNSLGPRPFAVYDGMDRELLSRASDWHGVDTRPLPVTEPRMATDNYDESLYGFHWLGQSFLFDYLTSLHPEQPVVDFEYHAFSINPIRIPEISPRHAEATLWLAHLHGMIGNMAWYWHRRYGPDPFPSRYFSYWLRNSISTQPLLASGYLQTMLQLNTYSEEVAALAQVPAGPVYLLVSNPSYIRDQDHVTALHRAYEALCFHGHRVGFVSERMLESGQTPENCRMIVIPNAACLSRHTLTALNKAAADHVKLIRVGKCAGALDEYGRAHSAESIQFLESLPRLEESDAPELSAAFLPLLQPYAGSLPIRIQVVGEAGTFGLMQRQVLHNGDPLLLLVNVSSRPLKIRLRATDGKEVTGLDLLKGEKLLEKQFPLPVQGVRLIRLKKTGPHDGA